MTIIELHAIPKMIFKIVDLQVVNRWRCLSYVVKANKSQMQDHSVEFPFYFFSSSYQTSSLVEWLELWVYNYKVYGTEFESIQCTSRSCSMDIVKMDAVQLYKTIRL
jgi:hypothetical protein